MVKWASMKAHKAKYGLIPTVKSFLNMSGWYKVGTVVGTDKLGNVYREQLDHPVNGKHTL